MLDGVALIERINAKGALLKVLDRAHLDLTTYGVLLCDPGVSFRPGRLTSTAVLKT
jgi:hypothetical protein